MNWKILYPLVLMLALSACGEKPAEPSAAMPATKTLATPVRVTHALGETVISQRPQRVAVLDMNELDFLEQLGIPVAGMPKDFVPHFLARYKNDPSIADLGAIVSPNLEKVYALKPDLILTIPLHAPHYQELSRIAPTLHLDIGYENNQGRDIDIIKDHLLTLGRIFDKQDVAAEKVTALDAKVRQVQERIRARPEKALIVLHNNGAYSAMGVQSRYGFVFNELGVKPASTAVEVGLHGQPVSSEFIQQNNPDILYVVDRTAVMEGRPVLDRERMENPLLRQTRAFQNNCVVFVDADAWYITAASPTSLDIIIDDVLKGYQD